MGTRRKNPSGPLPAVPPRRNLMLVKDDVRRSLMELEPKDAADLLRRVALEHSRDPSAGSIGPYLQALSEMQADKAASLIKAAGSPPAYKSVVNPDINDVLDAPPEPVVTPDKLDPYQQAAVKQIADLLDLVKQAGDISPGDADRVRRRIDDLIVLNDLDGAIQFDDGTTLAQLQEQIAPTLGDLTASENAPALRMTRADFPMEDRLSTYMGDAAENYVIKDQPLRGSPAGQLMKLAGDDAKAMLAQAGWSDQQIKAMGPEKIYRLVTEFSKSAEGSPAVTSRVRGPDGKPVEITTQGGGAGPRSKQIAGLRERISAQKTLPSINPQEIARARAEAGLPPDASVAGKQAAQRQRDLASLEGQLQEAISSPQYATGDSIQALKALNKRLAEMSGLSVDQSIAPDKFSHVLDRRLRLTPDEINALPPEAKLAFSRGEITSLEDLMAALPPEMLDSSSAMVGPALNLPAYGRAGDLIAKEDVEAQRGAMLGLRTTPYASVLEQIQHRMSMEPPRFSDEGPKAFPDQATKDSAIKYLTRQRDEMLARMGRASPPAIPAGRVGEISTHDFGPVRDAPEMRDPSNMAMEKWLQASGVTGSDMSGMGIDPETGERVMLGGENYFDNQTGGGGPPKPPGYVYGIPPQVDAQGNVTHPYQPMSGDLAARTFAWTLGAQDPKFASIITPTMQDSIDDNWYSGTPPKKGEAGSGMYFNDPQTGEPIRRKMMPGPQGLAFLQQQAQGGVAGGGRVNIQTRPERVDIPSPSLDELESMGVEDMPPNTPPPMPSQFKNALEELEALEAMDVEGELPPQRPGMTEEDANRMLQELNGLEGIPMDDDDTGFLGQTTMNRMPRRSPLSELLAA